jgi:uncharacterized protein YidB (DUF937 family)
MLANNGTNGGLGGLLQQFQQAGMGGQMGSWIGTGQNQSINADELSRVLGPQLGTIAQQLGVSHGEAADQLSLTLPAIIDHLTPGGQIPQGGLGNTEDILGQLTSLLRR